MKVVFEDGPLAYMHYRIEGDLGIPVSLKNRQHKRSFREKLNLSPCPILSNLLLSSFLRKSLLVTQWDEDHGLLGAKSFGWKIGAEITKTLKTQGV